jgi:hypothetical protein
VRLEASTKPHVHRKFEIFWINIASKNGPKNGLGPLGVKHAKMVLEAPYHKGSLVIVTARSKNILELLGIYGDACIEMLELGEGDAMNLFLYHAACRKQFAA